MGDAWGWLRLCELHSIMFVVNVHFIGFPPRTPTLAGKRHALLSETIWPEQLNAHSDGTDVTNILVPALLEKEIALPPL